MAPLVPIPYASQIRMGDMLRRRGDLIRQRGDQAAAAAERSGQIQAQMWGNLGNVVAGTAQNYQQAKQQQAEQQTRDQVVGLQVDAAKDAKAKRDAEAEQQRVFNEALQGSMVQNPDTGVLTYDRKKAQELVVGAKMGHLWPEVSKILDDSDAADVAVRTAHQTAIKSAAELVDRLGNDPTVFTAEIQRGIKNGRFTDAEAAPYLEAAQRDPESISKITSAILGKTPKLTNVPAGASVIDENNPTAGPVFTAPAAPEKPPTTIDAAILAAQQSNNQEAVNRLLALKSKLEAAGRAPEKPPAAGSLEQQIADALAKGDQATVDRLAKAAELAAGARARTQGRPVTSGDANNIADLKNSLADVATLGTTLGTTGAASKVGAMLPNVVTEYTGWGMDAKSRQGTIDRVKQVIGKALEGGVLRKEDEYKYIKILPTIGDPPPVAATKLAGLKKAIENKLSISLSALSDAGYDVSKFLKSEPPSPADDGWVDLGDGVKVREKK